MDCNSRYCWLDPYLGAQHAIAEATRNVSIVGGQPLGITNCLNFGNPERAPANWQLARAVDGLGDACRALGVPIVSGNVSLYNESGGMPIHPTPMVGCVGKVDDVGGVIGIAWHDGDDVLLLGDARPVLGGSDYLVLIHDRIVGSIPELDFAAERNVQECIRALALHRLCHAAHDVSGGGLAIALAEMAMASGKGAEIELPPHDGRVDECWFGESAGRVLISASPDRKQAISEVVGGLGVSLHALGRVRGDALMLDGSGDVTVLDLRTASERALAVLPEQVYI